MIKILRNIKKNRDEEYKGVGGGAIRDKRRELGLETIFFFSSLFFLFAV